MDRKLVIFIIGVVVIALIAIPSVADVAAPGSQARTLKQILTRVIDIQGRTGTPAEPAGYEYYTGWMMADPKTTIADDAVSGTAYVTNCGDTSADFCWVMYYRVVGTGEIVEFASGCETVEPGGIKSCLPVLVSDITRMYSYKFTTSSKYIVPWAAFEDVTTNEYLKEYLPGDFHKVEIYD